MQCNKSAGTIQSRCAVQRIAGSKTVCSGCQPDLSRQFDAKRWVFEMRPMFLSSRLQKHLESAPKVRRCIAAGVSSTLLLWWIQPGLLHEIGLFFMGCWQRVCSGRGLIPETRSFDVWRRCLALLRLQRGAFLLRTVNKRWYRTALPCSVTRLLLLWRALPNFCGLNRAVESSHGYFFRQGA